MEAVIGACWGAGRTQMQTQDTALNEQKPFYWGKQVEKHKTLRLGGSSTGLGLWVALTGARHTGHREKTE